MLSLTAPHGPRPSNTLQACMALIFSRRRSTLGRLAVGCLGLVCGLVISGSARAEPIAVQGLDHVGINVPNADQAVAFFGATFGTKVVMDLRPAQPPRAWRTRFRWHASSKIRRIVMVRTADQSTIEFLEYAAPLASRRQPRIDDIGASHIAMRTADLDLSLSKLRERGVTVLNNPAKLPDGMRFAYLLAPWGEPIELVQWTKPAR